MSLSFPYFSFLKGKSWLKSMNWKKNLHNLCKTYSLIQATWAQCKIQWAERQLMPFLQQENSEDSANKPFSSCFNLDLVTLGPKHPRRMVYLWPLPSIASPASPLVRRTQPNRQFELLEWYKEGAIMVTKDLWFKAKLVSLPLWFLISSTTWNISCLLSLYSFSGASLCLPNLQLFALFLAADACLCLWASFTHLLHFQTSPFGFPSLPLHSHMGRISCKHLQNRFIVLCLIPL